MLPALPIPSRRGFSLHFSLLRRSAVFTRDRRVKEVGQFAGTRFRIDQRDVDRLVILFINWICLPDRLIRCGAASIINYAAWFGASVSTSVTPCLLW